MSEIVRPERQEQTSSSSSPAAPGSRRHGLIPEGYRSGVITAITVVLGFSFLFLRSWAFELPGDWTPTSLGAAILLLCSIVLQLVALWRSLQLKDAYAGEYEKTLRWFLAAIIVLLVSLVAAGISYSLPAKL